VYNRHRRWSADGTWATALAGLRRGGDRDTTDGEWVIGVDAAVIRAHHHAAGARILPPADVAEDVLCPEHRFEYRIVVEHMDSMDPM